MRKNFIKMFFGAALCVSVAAAPMSANAATPADAAALARSLGIPEDLIQAGWNEYNKSPELYDSEVIDAYMASLQSMDQTMIDQLITDNGYAPSTPAAPADTPDPEPAPTEANDDTPSSGGSASSDDKPSSGGSASNDDKPSTGGNTSGDDKPSSGGNTSGDDKPSTGGNTSSDDKPSSGGDASNTEKPTSNSNASDSGNNSSNNNSNSNSNDNKPSSGGNSSNGGGNASGGNSSGNTAADDIVLQLPDGTEFNRVSSKKFAAMTLEEKRAYIATFPEEQQQVILSNLTPEDYKSLLKQLPVDDKAEVIDKMADATSQLGLTLSIDELTDDNVVLTMKDSEGKLLAQSSARDNVAATGYDRRGILAIAASLAAIGAAGAFIIAKKSFAKENEE